MSSLFKSFLAPVASTGNNTHASVGVPPFAYKVAGMLVIEAVGATPTITAKIQGTLDDSTVADGSANWFDLPFVSDTNDTVAASLTKTAVGAYPMFVSLSTSLASCAASGSSLPRTRTSPIAASSM
jgi:hypothetical protein